MLTVIAIAAPPLIATVVLIAVRRARAARAEMEQAFGPLPSFSSPSIPDHRD
ncbi:hypothetical protein ACQP10_38060 (plasmid) [Streptosporangium sandarakinum]|uniref:hypothetical protein n=1 Tax=Streptosporangium sandarakinum TaxID=1260955 RepID=UPI003D8DCA99